MFNGLKEKLKEYIDTKLQLYQLTIEEKIVLFASNLLYLFLISAFALVSFVFLLLLLAKIIIYYTNNQFAGYGFVLSLCLFLLYLLLKSKSRLYITNQIKFYLLSNLKKQQHGE